MTIEVEVPTGFLSVAIKVNESVLEQYDLLYYSASIEIFGKDLEDTISEAVEIGDSELLLLKPGTYTVVAVLGGVSSEPTNIKIINGKVTNITFYFGEKSD